MINAAAMLVVRTCTGTDKSGVYEYLHPFGVYGKLVGHAPEVQVVGLLHDMLEDYPTTITVEELRKKGFSERIIRAVQALTHAKGESYREYIMRVAKDPIAVVVKLADISYNENRLDDGIAPDDAARMREKWAGARDILTKLT